MNEETVAIIITSILSTISLLISIKTYVVNKPKMRIFISDKESDVYFGTVCAKDNRIVPSKIGAVELNIVNNSPVDIYIKNIKLKIGKNYHKLINKNLSYWKECYFFYTDENGTKNWDGSGINYEKNGVKFPSVVKSYTILSGICLFNDFPNTDNRIQKGEIVLTTAVGKIIKRVKFIKYDKNYISEEMKDVELFLKNKI